MIQSFINLNEELRPGLLPPGLIMWHAVTWGRPESLTTQYLHAASRPGSKTPVRNMSLRSSFILHEGNGSGYGNLGVACSI